jgi:hypothetical protein
VQVYGGYLQEPAFPRGSVPAITVLARTAQDPAAIGSAMKSAILDTDRSQPVFATQPMTEVVSQSLALRRMAMAHRQPPGVRRATIASALLHRTAGRGVDAGGRSPGLRRRVRADAADERSALPFGFARPAHARRRRCGFSCGIAVSRLICRRGARRGSIRWRPCDTSEAPGALLTASESFRLSLLMATPRNLTVHNCNGRSNGRPRRFRSLPFVGRPQALFKTPRHPAERRCFWCLLVLGRSRLA